MWWRITDNIGWSIMIVVAGNNSVLWSTMIVCWIPLYTIGHLLPLSWYSITHCRYLFHLHGAQLHTIVPCLLSWYSAIHYCYPYHYRVLTVCNAHILRYQEAKDGFFLSEVASHMYLTKSQSYLSNSLLSVYSLPLLIMIVYLKFMGN